MSLLATSQGQNQKAGYEFRGHLLHRFLCQMLHWVALSLECHFKRKSNVLFPEEERDEKGHAGHEDLEASQYKSQVPY